MSLTCAEEISNSTSEAIKRNYYYFSVTAHTILSIIYVIISIIGILGNLSTWLTIPFYSELRSPMNYLLLNLSLAHLIANINVLLFCFVLDTGKIASSQNSRNIACAFTEGLGLYFIAAGTYLLTLCVISFNRYMAIQYPTRQGLRMQKKSVFVYNTAVWIIATLWIIPSMISFRYEEKIQICLRDWRFTHPVVYRISALLWSIAMPLTFLLLCFGAILWRRKDNIPFIPDQPAFVMRRLNLHKAEKLLGFLILSYLMTWIPFFIYWILYTANYFPGCSGEINAMRWLRVTVLFTAMNSVVDPFIYVYGSKEHKRIILRIVSLLYHKLTCNSLNRVSESNNTSSTPQNLISTPQHQLVQELATLTRASARII